MNKKIKNRRENVCILNLKGYKNKEISTKLEVSESTIEKDLKWIRNNTDSELQQLHTFGIREEYLHTLLQYNMLLKETLQDIEQSKDSLIKADLRKIVLKTLFDKQKLLQKLPRVPKTDQEWRKENNLPNFMRKFA